MGEIGLDGPVLAFTFGLSIVTGILSGLLPALGMTKGDVSSALKQGLGRTDADSGSSNTRSALVAVEVALSVVSPIGAGLMIRSLWKLQTIDPGFDQHNVLTLAVNGAQASIHRPYARITVLRRGAATRALLARR